MRNSKLLLIPLIFFLFQPVAYSQEDKRTYPEIDFQQEAEKANTEKLQNQIYPSNQIRLIQEYNLWAFKHTKSFFSWSFISSIIIFFIVHIIIGFGIYFSYIQFKNTVITQGEEISTSSLKISKDGLEVSSSVMGIITLLISLAFFYLYIEKIYPITTTDIITPQNSVIPAIEEAQ
ncbi:MAG: hypothetical protein AAFQ80_15120 [Cyanobacteria bacterium J06621_8]